MSRYALAALFCCFGAIRPGYGQVTPPRWTVFDQVNVITADGVDTNQTVIVDRGTIAEVGRSARVTIPQGAQLIDGRGRYLSPGLIDAHVHVKDRAHLDQYLMYGVTTVRNMRGEPRLLRWRDAIATGELRGPALITASPTTYSEPGRSFAYLAGPVEARDSVARYSADGYDLVKVFRLPQETLNAAVGEAHRHSMPVSGHYADLTIPIREMVSSGITSVEHAQEFFYVDEIQNLPAEQRINAIVERLQGSDVAVVTMVVDLRETNRLALLEEDFLDREMEEALGYFSGMKSLSEHLSYVQNAKADGTWEMEDVDQVLELVAALHAAGITIVAATDAGSHLALPGASLHAEMDLLLGAGIAPADVLAMATVNAAELLGLADHKGRIRAGYDADMLLLSDNPLENLRTMREPLGVMARGQWLDGHDLELLHRVR